MFHLNSKAVGLLLLLGIHIPLFLYFFFTDTYPLIFIAIHLLCLAFLYFWTLKPDTSRLLRKKYAPDICIIAILFFVALAIRLYRVDQITPGMWGDEVGYAKLGERLVDSGTFTPFSDDLFAPPTPFLYILGWTVKLLGRSLVTVRLPAVVFGALGVAAAYAFLRTIFHRSLALSGAIILLVLHQHIVLSRLTYEMTATVFFEFLSLLYIYRMYKTASVRDGMAAVLFLGAGLYTYLGFRTTAVFLFLLITILVLSRRTLMKEKLKYLFILYAVLFLSVVPWLSFSLRHPAHVLARAQSVSVFHQNFSSERLVKEILGNTKMSLGMFWNNGDPNPRYNPSRSAMYDPIFAGIAALGLVYLLRKHKSLAYAGLFLMIPSLVNDIFSVELFPEFHYYGTGHPATARVLGLLPILLFFFVSGLNAIAKLPFLRTNTHRILVHTLLGVIVIAACFVNWNLYFNQKPNQFIYYANGVPALDVVAFLNRAGAYNTPAVAMSSKLADDQRVQYFSDPRVARIPLVITKDETSIDVIPVGIYTLIYTNTSPVLARELTDQEFQQKNHLEVRALPPNPWNVVDTLIVYRKE